MSILVTLLISVAAVSVAAQEPKLDGTTMLDCSGLPCVDATTANGKHLRLLVDTGNVNSIIDAAIAKRNGLTVSPLTGADGKPVAGLGLTTLAGVKLGEAPLGDVKALVMDLSDGIKRDRMPAVDGTLAYTAFNDRVLELDYLAKRVRVSEKLSVEPACTGSCGTLTTPNFGHDGPPILVTTGFSVNGKSVTAQIDTLFSGSMLIYTTAVQKLGLAAEAQATIKQFFKYTDDGVNMLQSQAKSESFGDRLLLKDAPLYFPTAEVHQPDGLFDATVGDALFRNSILTFDLRGIKFQVVRNE